MESVKKFESILDTVGYGIYQKGMIGICSMCLLSSVFSHVCAIFILPIAICDMEMSLDTIKWCNCCITLGIALGGVIFGNVSDISGRKSVIPASVFVIFTGAVIICFSANKATLIMGSIVIGVGVGGANNSLHVFIIEILPETIRGSRLIILDIVWMAGFITSFALSWKIVPDAKIGPQHDFRLNSWRIVLALAASSCVLTACVTGILRPSPRHLLHRRKKLEATTVLKHMFAFNMIRYADDYEIPQLDNIIKASDTERPEQQPEGCIELCLMERKACFVIRRFLKSSFKCRSVIAAMIALSTFPGFIMMNISLAESLSCPYCMSMDVYSPCTNGLESNIINPSLILGACSLLFGGIIFALIVDATERKYYLASFLSISAIMCLVMPWTDRIIRRVSSGIFACSYSATQMLLNIMIPEMFPTDIRATAYGLVYLLPGLLLFSLQSSNMDKPEIIFYTVSGCSMLALCLIFLLPSLTKKPMVE